MLNKLKSGIVGDVSGQLGGLGKQIGKGVVKAGTGVVKTTPKQIAGEQEGLVEQEKKRGIPQANKDSEVQQGENNQEFVKSLYKKTATTEDPEKNTENTDRKNVQEDQKMAALRQQLHQEYYQRLINPPKPKEERPAEKIEKEEKMEEMDLQKKEEKKLPPLAVQRERNKIEQRPGAG